MAGLGRLDGLARPASLCGLGPRRPHASFCKRSSADERSMRQCPAAYLLAVFSGLVTGAVMWWFVGAGGGLLMALVWWFAPTWRALIRSYPPEARDAAAVFWAEHSSSHG